MKKTIHIMMLIAALTIAWGCSSDSSDGGNYTFTTSTARPDWAIDWYNNEPAPNWEEPNKNLFEHSMYIILTLPENLVPFSTDDDLMAVFINNECRSVAKASPLEDGSKVYFVNTVRGNDTDKEVYFTLKYYSGGLRHTFVIDGTDQYVPDLILGLDEDFVPNIMAGSTKYPYQMVIEPTLTGLVPFTPSPDDQIAVFVGNECRGVAQPQDALTIVVYGRHEGEEATIRYYSAKQQAIYTFNEQLTIQAMSQPIPVQLSF
jgi:hypothetical protein